MPWPWRFLGRRHHEAVHQGMKEAEAAADRARQERAEVESLARDLEAIKKINNISVKVAEAFRARPGGSHE